MTRKESESHCRHICEVTGFDLQTALLGGLPTYLMTIAAREAHRELFAAANDDAVPVVYSDLVPGIAVPERAILKRMARIGEQV